MTNREMQVLDRKARERDEWDGRRPHKLFHALQSQPAIADALLAQGAVLMDEVQPRTRELVALRVGAVRNCRYVWAAHTQLAAEVGLTRGDIARVAISPTVFAGRDAAVLWCTDHVLANRPIDDATQRMLGEDGVLLVRLTAKFYDTIANVMADATPEPEVTAVSGLETPADACASYAALTS
jgi:AhpD family alkylhydroperoxidase